MEHENNFLKIFEKEYESKLNDYRHEDKEENEKFIIEKLSKLPIDQIIKQIKLDELLWDFDDNSLYPSAILVEKSIFPRIETGYAYTIDLSDELLEKFNTQTFNQGSVFFLKNISIHQN